MIQTIFSPLLFSLYLFFFLSLFFFPVTAQDCPPPIINDSFSLSSSSYTHARDRDFPSCTPRNQWITYDMIKDFGAVGDNKTDNVLSFNKVMLAASNNNGTIIIVPSGIFMSSPFQLTSCIDIVLANNDSIIQALTIVDKWPVGDDNCYLDFMRGNAVTDVRITGEGIIDGGGYNWWFLVRGKTLKHGRRMLITFVESQNLVFTHFNIHNSMQFNVYPVRSQHIFVDNLHVRNPSDSVNTDGFDPEACNNITIINSYISTGDDGIAIKGYTGFSSNIHVHNLTVNTAHCGFVIGSHALGGTDNITINEATFNHTVNGICFKGTRGAGGETKNYKASNIIINMVDKSAISLDDYYCSAGGCNNSSPIVPITHDITITNLTAYHTGSDAGILYGLNDSYIYNIQLSHIHITGYKQPWFCQYINGTYEDVTPTLSNCTGMVPKQSKQSKQWEDKEIW